MVFHGKINSKTRAYAYYLRAEGSLSYREISKKCHILPSSVVRICKEALAIKKQKKITGRPPIISRREKQRFIRTFQQLRNENANVTVHDVAKECSVTKVSYRTLVRLMNENGYRCLQPRQKGLLLEKDRRRRQCYARQAIQKYDRKFWTDDVLLYLDGVATDALHDVGAELIEIPPRSPDLNRFENIFNNVKSQLVKEALYLKIEKESCEEFCVRVLQTLFNFDSSIIDRTVATMHDRLKIIAKNGIEPSIDCCKTD